MDFHLSCRTKLGLPDASTEREDGREHVPSAKVPFFATFFSDTEESWQHVLIDVSFGKGR
jgi:hypothetical protein